MLLRIFAFLWILAGFLLLSVKAEACPGKYVPAQCDHVLGSVCFEFVEESKSWFQARRSCENRGGKLLKMFSDPIKNFLEEITRERPISDFTWWLGDGVQKEHTIQNDDISEKNCTYMKLNPLQLIMTDCNQKRGSLCTYSLLSSRTMNTEKSDHTGRPRLRRSVDSMNSSITDIVALLSKADIVLVHMEQTPGEPTNYNRDNFIRYLLEATENLTPEFAMENNNTISHIINCSTAILQLSMKKCDHSTNPNPTNLFEQIFAIFRAIAILVGPGSTEILVMKHPSGTIYQTTIAPEELDNLVLGSEETGELIKLPPFSALQSHLGNYEKVIAQMLTFSSNPHPSDDNITGILCSLILSGGDSDIKIENLSEMIEIFLPRPEAATLTNSTVVLKEKKIALTRINVTDPNMTIFFTIEPNFNVSLKVTLTQDEVLTPTSSSNSTILSPEGGYRWMISPELLQQSPGIWYIDARLHNSTWQPGLTLNITSFVSKCLYWNEEKETWSTDGCQVGEKSTPELTQCLCNHLTLFGSSFFVMPNYVDVSRTAELFATVTKNYVVLALLCTFYGLYLITLLWACYADRRSRNKRRMTLLDDNHPGAQYNYLISVQTGTRKNAGTTANVTVKLTGSDGESEIHTLTDPVKSVFERGAVDMFILAAPFPLGDVRNIRLQHDNTGGHPSWYIDKVIIQDLQTRQVWHFFCDCWLSNSHGDSVTKKTFNAAKSNEIASFRNIFHSRTSTGFRDEHIWVSIVDPPSRSPFTRAQRVSCCMSLLLCTMAINIAFWNIPINEESPVLFSFGPLRITWQEVMVGVESGLLMFPINILIITIFRSIRPRIISDAEKNDSENFRPPPVSIPSVLKETDEVVTMISSSPKNKMSDVPRLVTTTDLSCAMDKIHELVQLMQGESESSPHWLFSCKFLLAGLCHLLMCLEKLDAKNFPSPEEYQQAVNTANLLVRKTEMVLSSHLASCPAPVRRVKKKTVGCTLPWWFVFLGWFLLLSISGISTFFTLLYGFEYGKEKSIMWVMSLGLSLFQSIFILQPLKVIGIAMFFALLLKPVAVEETEETEQVLLKQQLRCSHYTGRHTL